MCQQQLGSIVDSQPQVLRQGGDALAQVLRNQFCRPVEDSQNQVAAQPSAGHGLERADRQVAFGVAFQQGHAGRFQRAPGFQRPGTATELVAGRDDELKWPARADIGQHRPQGGQVGVYVSQNRYSHAAPGGGWLRAGAATGRQAETRLFSLSSACRRWQ